MNNVQKTLRNSIFSVSAQIVTMILGFVSRRVFIIYLDIELLGYQTLFSNVFSLLSVAELGIGEIITFHLYKEIVENNEEEIGKLMTLYKWMYRCVAMTVLVFGSFCYFILPLFVREENADWSFLHLVYFFQLAGVVLGYFLSYKRTIYFANQKEYKCAKIDIAVKFTTETLRLVLLVYLKSFLVYLVIGLSTQIIANVIIALRSRKDYPYLKKKYSVSIEDIKKKNLFSDLSNFLVHSICGAIYFGTDNLIISAFCGVRTVGLYGNYTAISSSVTQLFLQKLLNPVKATIGNIVYGNRSKEELWEQFRVFDIFSFFYAAYIGLGFLIFYQPVIQIWMGKELLLPFSFVVLYSMTIYANAVTEIVYKYRSVFGGYKNDRNFVMASAVSNLLVSIPGAMFFGVPGVQFGTLVAFLLIAYGRNRLVIKGFFHQSRKQYYGRHLVYFFIVIVEGVFCALLGANLPVSLSGFVLRTIIWIAVPTVINILVFYRDTYFQGMVRMLRKMIKR